MPKQLTSYDFIIMRLLRSKSDYSIRGLHEDVNGFIVGHKVSAEYAVPHKHKRSTEYALSRLRGVGYVTPAPAIQATVRSDELWNWVGEFWRTWPYYVPIVEGKVDYSQMKERT